MDPSNEYKLTDLDYLVGDHHLQMMKAALPYMNLREQKLLSMLVKFQELRRTYNLFRTGETASMGICSLDSPSKSGSIRDMLKAIRPFGNPSEREMIDMAQMMMDGQAPLEHMKHFLSPEQQARMENLQMMIQAMQVMA